MSQTVDAPRLLSKIQAIDQSILDLEAERVGLVRSLTAILERPLPALAPSVDKPKSPPSKYLRITQPHLFGGTESKKSVRQSKKRNSPDVVRTGGHRKNSIWPRPLWMIVHEVMTPGRDTKVSEVQQDIMTLYPEITKDYRAHELRTCISGAMRNNPKYFQVVQTGIPGQFDTATFRALPTSTPKA